MKKIDLDKFSEEEALHICAEVLHSLILKGINKMTLTTDDDEIINVRISKPIKQDLTDESVDKTIKDLTKH